MASPKILLAKESTSELKKLLKSAKPIIYPRLRMLIESKKHESKGISRRDLASILQCDPNSIQNWRRMYEEGGIEALCSYKLTGFKPSVITEQEHLELEKKLSDPYNGIIGYKELQEWFLKTYDRNIKHNTLMKYCKRNFGTKIKVARKSHVKKDQEQVELFKKTSHPSAKKKS